MGLGSRIDGIAEHIRIEDEHLLLFFHHSIEFIAIRYVHQERATFQGRERRKNPDASLPQ